MKLKILWAVLPIVIVLGGCKPREAGGKYGGTNSQPPGAESQTNRMNTNAAPHSPTTPPTP